MKQILTLLLFAKKKQHKLPVFVVSKKQDPAVSEHGNPYEVGALSMLQALLCEEESNCPLILILAKRIPIMKNTGPELSIATVTNVCTINVGVIDRMTDIARPGDITTHTDKVKSGGNGHDTIVVTLVVSTCVVADQHVRHTSGQHVRNLIRRATNGTHRSGGNVMKTSSDSSDNCKRKLHTNSKRQRMTFQIRARHPFLQRRPHVNKAKGLVI